MNLIRTAIASYPVESYPDSSKRYKYIIKFIFRGLLSYSDLKSLDGNVFGEYRQQLFSKQPDFLSKCMRPYLYLGLNPKNTVTTLINHHNWCKAYISKKNHSLIYSTGIILDKFLIDDEEFYMTLSYDPRYWKEGELTIKLTDSTLTKNLYVISFTVSNKAAYIGGVQGPDHDDGLSKKLTKAMFGLRPKSLMVETLRIVLKCLSVEKIFGVTNESLVYGSVRYHSKVIHFDYNRLWEEHQGTVYNNHFYKVPLISERKVIEDLKRQKRKMYRERYEWLNTYSENIEKSLFPEK